MRHYLFCLLMALPLCFTACSSDITMTMAVQRIMGKSILQRLQLKSTNGNLVSDLNMVIFMSVIRIMKRTS